VTRTRWIFIVGTALLLAPVVWAAVTLSVVNVRGGVDLDFGRIAPGAALRTEELEVRMTSAGGAQYRLYQELPGGLMNERGERLPEGALMMELSGGLRGTRGREGRAPVTERLQELYVSETAGTSDSLHIAYAIVSSSLPPGVYRGILRFSVESRDGSPRVTETIRAQAVVESAFELQLGEAAPHQLSLGAVAPGDSSLAQEVPLRLSNTAAQPTQVLGELAEPFVNARRDTLPENAIRYAVSSAAGQEPWQPLRSGSTVLLSDPRGQIGEFRLGVTAAIPPNQPAGRYQGRMRLQASHAGGGATLPLLLPIDVAVNEIFMLSVTPIGGPDDSLQFARAEPGTTERQMAVAIRTNLGRPYEVQAGLDHPLVLPGGEMLPRDAMVWSMTPPRRGRALVQGIAPVPIGYGPLYRSDEAGSPDEFVLSYRLTIPQEAKSGLYKGQLRFTITMF